VTKEKTEKLRKSIHAKRSPVNLLRPRLRLQGEKRDYETAEILLEKIKEERGKGGKKR